MSKDIWLISDTHFGHDNIIRYCNRPFENSYYMNQCIRDNWNQTIKPQDIVYHLGDVYMGKNWTGGETIEQFLKSLHGHKRLLLGNHDDGKDQTLQKVFEKINIWRMFPEFKLMLTHVPIHAGSFRHKCELNIHGHTHDNDVLLENMHPDKRYVNICVEKTNYFPISIDSLKVV